MTEVRNNSEKHRFEITFDDGTAAFAEYRLGAGTMTFPHTVVPDGHEGQGHGTRLVEAGLAFAREKGLRVIPLCRFFAAYVRQHREAQDLVDPGFRDKLGIG